MKKSVMFLLLSLVCLSVSAQNGKVKSGVIGGVSMDWYKDEAMSKGKVGFNIPDMKPSFHVGYQLQFELKHRLSVDAALLYGQKRGEIASVGNKATPVKGYKSKFARNYMHGFRRANGSMRMRFVRFRFMTSADRPKWSRI